MKVKKLEKVKRKRFVPDKFRYKLTEIELDRLAFRGIITPEHRDLLICASRLRTPNFYAASRFQTALNQKGTIMMNSINREGGEHIGDPYHFLAEITHKVNKSVFTRFMRANRMPCHPFKD